jgi:hypothetical protein
MELKEFIESTLVDISEGIKAAVEKTGNDYLIIAPSYYQESKTKRFSPDCDIQDIEFDVAVTAVDKVAGGVKAGVKVLGAKAEGSSEYTNVSRIKFSVTVGIKKP